MKFKGRVTDIIFSNEENGYTVLNFQTDDDYFTAVGIFPFVSVGELLELTGEFKTNNKFGEQFAVESVSYSKPDDAEGIFKYLASGLFRGIGEKLARQIVNYFGLRTLEILENNPDELRKVPGIGRKKLSEIVESYRDTRNMKEAIFFLQKYDITMGLAMKIYRCYEEATVSVIKNNPYILVEDIEGVGFLTADKIAEKMGIDRHSEFRIKAGILHSLNEAAAKGGHTCLPKQILIENAAKLMEVEESEVAKTLESAGGIRFAESEGMMIAATEMNFRAENAIATKLILLKQTADRWDMDVEKELSNYEKSSAIVFHEKQREAIKSVFSSGVTVITGGPGTGKTTIIKAITGIAGQRGKKVVLCAPTGRAGKRMTEMTGMESKTIHRLLGVDFSKGGFEKNESNPLEADVIIVDEISMADIYVFYALTRAVSTGTRVVLVGDKDQLPSVSCGNILSDVISSKIINTVFLSEIYRQEGNSLIVTNAHRINRGEMPLTDNLSDFFISNKTDSMDILNTVIGMIKTRIPKFANVDTSDIAVLTPLKKGIVGVENLNEKIQDALNPDAPEFKYKNIAFRTGDKVMQNVNNYTVSWKKFDTGEIGSGVFNGDLGTVSAVRKDGVDVMFDDGKLVNYSGSAMDELMLAYCISVHKSQGSEFPVVVIALSGANYMLMTRNLLYTAVTRARKMAVIVGEEGCIRRMVSNNYTAKRYSLLKDFLIKNKHQVELLWGSDED